MVAGKIDGKEFRQVLGHYPTGVCVVTAMGDDGPKGMVVGTFTSVSLDPPLVAFLPERRSKSWAAIAATGGFCVNVLSEHQRDVCQALASRSDKKFATVSYRFSDAGRPIIEGAVAWIDCDIHQIYAAGDHDIVVGVVRDLAVEKKGLPLIFAQGGLGTFLPSAAEAAA